MKKLTAARIEAAIARVQKYAAAGRDESAHANEDELLGDVLRAIATDDLADLSPAAAARLVLKTCDIYFARCCA